MLSNKAMYILALRGCAVRKPDTSVQASFADPLLLIARLNDHLNATGVKGTGMSMLWLTVGTWKLTDEHQHGINVSSTAEVDHCTSQ